jgi:hypothetical protein
MIRERVAKTFDYLRDRFEVFLPVIALAGFLYAILHKRWPNILEFLGVLVLLIAILSAFHRPRAATGKGPES